MVLQHNSASIKRLRLPVLLLCLAAVAGGALWLATALSSQSSIVESPPTPQSSEALPLSVPAGKLDFGEVWEDEKFVLTLPITNRGSEALKIRQFVASCGCMGIEPKSLEIAAQATCTIQATFNLTRGKPQPGETVRPFSAQVTALIDAKPLRHKKWTVCGKVRKLYDLVPELISFEEGSLIQGQAFPGRTVEVSCHTELTGLTAECRPPAGTVVVAPCKKRNVFSVTVTPNKDLPAGNLEFDVVLRGHTTGAVVPPVPLKIAGRVLQEVEAIPPVVLFGHHALGERAEDTVVLRSRTGKAFRVVAVESGRESIETERLPESSDSSPQFRVQQTFRKTGQQTATVSFHVQIDDRRITVAVPVRYCGLPKTAGER